MSSLSWESGLGLPPTPCTRAELPWSLSSWPGVPSSSPAGIPPTQGPVEAKGITPVLDPGKRSICGEPRLIWRRSAAGAGPAPISGTLASWEEGQTQGLCPVPQPSRAPPTLNNKTRAFLSPDCLATHSAICSTLQPRESASFGRC
ncbi:hypothetical protein R6Z07F_019415 [Ovis aries]